MVATNSTRTVNLDESRAGQVTTAIIICPALALVAVALRLYSRVVLGKKRFLEDYFIVVAMVRVYRKYQRSLQLFTPFIVLIGGHVRVHGYLYVCPFRLVHSVQERIAYFIILYSSGSERFRAPYSNGHARGAYRATQSTR
jgi:hypothetical protein